MKVILYMPLGEKDEYGGYQAKNKKNPLWTEYPHPDLTHTKLPFTNCIPASDVPHFSPTDSAVIWLEMGDLYSRRKQLIGLQLRLDPQKI